MSPVEMKKKNETNSRLEPQTHNEYTAPGFDVLDLDAVEKLLQDPDNVVFCHAVTVVKISPEVVVKFGPDFNNIEARNMMYVAKKTPRYLYRKFSPIQHTGLLIMTLVTMEAYTMPISL
ncbi:hypothetical protein N7478_004335 [Penicillium angulare]|uniref:uncharacterized protein n=1 Tax=Penicillium angulare TaxID=116970 RepID=UPI002542497A|nr:uncharacterized protein N7478_004335 [Penicillium angulare]KAJ5278963.1 hypothetical protein N7478_004335 [Penicillium angulare]